MNEKKNKEREINVEMAILSDSEVDDDDDDDDDDIYGNLNGSKKLKMKNKYHGGADEDIVSKPSANAEERPKVNLSRVYIEMR